ncbi:ABC transporter substrate-binding protein [Nocardioides sp. GY 10127]|uniref:ABC transporter substrate-binding protein n=1 Tax=Nocardioides sp. GY 10127 TaxID=2569762 RepID=UPI0010A936CC|nr:ABC transporter substrate-binding protein [Nocardioides sp. GY 10127]TIC81812.1 cobalamin-binding protein [Nocardioides sp. GY 10127]
MRVVSLLPSTTEICFALGAGKDVVGVTFECDHPAEARTRRVVSSTTMPTGLDPAGIDAWVRRATAAGEDLYHLNADALADLDAHPVTGARDLLVLTQDLCAVCALDVSTVDQALTHLGCTAEVVSYDPHTLADLREGVLTIAERLGRPEAGMALAARFDPALAAVARADAEEEATRAARPRVVVLEWTDPPYAPGHWLPEMVLAAGGEPVLGHRGERSVPTTWEAVAAARPDLVVVAPCGYDRTGAQEQADALVAAGRLPAGVPVHAVDADGCWARPGPRVLDGIADLAARLARL